jgi:colanic acid biosynthesis glycosyl transferase WcaI
MKKRVLLIGGNFYPEPIGIGKYNGEMIEWLTENGYECTVITSFPYYPQWKVQQPYVKSSFWYKKEVKYYKPFYEKCIDIYRCPQYVPATPTGIKRMLNGLTFLFTAFFVIVKLMFNRKYDYVISVVPSFETGLLAIFYKKFRGAKFLYHIQDLQIDAARDLKILKSPRLIEFLLKIEKYILKNADVVSSVSSGMMEKVQTKCNKKVDFFPNWVDTKIIFPISDKSKLKQEFGFDSKDRIILYSGAVGEKQGLENILYAAHSFQHVVNLKFVVCGSGPYLKKLAEIKRDLALNNVVFMPTQPVEKLNHLLNMADLHLIIQKANASDLVMPSKLTNILAIGGVSIVTAIQNSSLHELISSHKLGIIAPPDNVWALVKVIDAAVRSSNIEISISALEYARRNFSIGNIISNFSLHMKEVHSPEIPNSMNLHLNNQLLGIEA